MRHLGADREASGELAEGALTFVRAVLVLSAVPFASVGAAFLVAPVRMAAFVDLTVEGATADGDIRAVYGGLQLGCAFLLLASARHSTWYRPGLVAQLCLYGGLASARFVSYPIAGPPSTLGLFLHGGELVGLAAGLLAWRTLTRGDGGIAEEGG